MKAPLLLIVIFTVLGLGYQPFVQAQHAVGHTTIDFVDASRSRTIQTEVYYPATVAGNDVALASGTFPVVVFGHGFVMIYSAYENVWTDLVPEGYIMLFPRTEGNISPNHDAFGLDLAFLEGAMQAENGDNASLFYQKVEAATAIMGHSMGGGCTMLAAENNTTIKTIIGLAPAETNSSAIAAAVNISVPALIMSGSSDGVTPPVDHHIPIYNDLGSTCKTFISITGGAHCYFANSNFNCDFGEGTSSSGITATRTEQQTIAATYTRYWLDYFLRDNCDAWTDFNSTLAADADVTYQQTCSITTTQATITENNGILAANTGVGYQWYLDGVIINGATSQNYAPNQNGDYTVVVTYASGCASESDSYTILGVGMDRSVWQKSWKVFPNPTSGQVQITWSHNIENATQLIVADVTGKTILTQVLSSDNDNSLEVNLEGADAGLYMVRLVSKRNSVVLPLVKLNR